MAEDSVWFAWEVWKKNENVPIKNETVLYQKTKGYCRHLSNAQGETRIRIERSQVLFRLTHHILGSPIAFSEKSESGSLVKKHLSTLIISYIDQASDR